MARDVDGGATRAWTLFRIVAWSGAAIVMVLPLIAMRFTDEVAWTGSDFVFAGALLGGTGLLFELALRASRSNAYRLGVVVALGSSFLLTWANLAVGIVGDEDNPANLIFFGVIAVAALGAVASGFRAAGMARAMFAAAFVQALASTIAISSGLDLRGAIYALFFTLPWLIAGALFRRAAQETA